MPLDPRAIHFSTDGSCYKNPGWEFRLRCDCGVSDRLGRQDEIIVDFGCAESSNNRMELMACIEKHLEWVRENQPWQDVTRVQIVTDSTYITENVSYRARGWKKNKWRNDSESRWRMSLWDDLLAAQTKSGIRVDFVWRLGKKSATGKTVDKAAKAAAQRGGISKSRGYRRISCTVTRSGRRCTTLSAKGQSDVIRPYAKKVMFRGENRIGFNIFVEGTQTWPRRNSTHSQRPRCPQTCTDGTDTVRFNDDPNYPQFLERIEEMYVSKLTAEEKLFNREDQTVVSCFEDAPEEVFANDTAKKSSKSATVIGSLGGGSIIVFGLSGYLGKRWADRALEKQKQEYRATEHCIHQPT